MSRAWRIEYEGALYHLMSPGIGRQNQGQHLGCFSGQIIQGKRKDHHYREQRQRGEQGIQGEAEGQVVIGRVDRAGLQAVMIFHDRGHRERSHLKQLYAVIKIEYYKIIGSPNMA